MAHLIQLYILIKQIKEYWDKKNNTTQFFILFFKKNVITGLEKNCTLKKIWIQLYILLKHIEDHWDKKIKNKTTLQFSSYP